MRNLRGSNRALSRRDILKSGAAGACALALAGLRPGAARAARMHTAPRGLIKARRSPWFSALENGALRCELCPRHCRIDQGRRGACRVRENRSGNGYTLVFGNPCLVQIDPVERTPFFHVLPGSRSLSLSTAGCNMECRFCEVWDMALVAPEDVHAHDVAPETAVAQAGEAGARSISYAFGEPVVFYEYMEAIAARAHAAGLLNLVQTNGYIAGEPLRRLCGKLDAVNVDLKSFNPAFYREVCGGELEPVLQTLKALRAAGVHIEITSIVIPSLNDDAAEIRAMSRWIAKELGAATPIHFARFYPLYKLANLPATPLRTLNTARAIAMEEGLEYVYVARATGHEGENTFCPRCKSTVIRRMGFVVEEVRMKAGACGSCGAAIAGRWK